MKKKIGIMIWYYYLNFGSALQAYALQSIIIDLGYDVSILEWRDLKYGKVHILKNRIKFIISELFPKRFSYPFCAFQNKYMNLTKIIQDKAMLPKIAKKMDCCVCRSDQIWAPNVFNSIYMLDFLPDEIEKVSYSASIELNEIPERLIPVY